MPTLGQGPGDADIRPPREQCEDGGERGECSPLVLLSNKPCMRTAGGLVPTCSEQPVKGKQIEDLLDFYVTYKSFMVHRKLVLKIIKKQNSSHQ